MNECKRVGCGFYLDDYCLRSDKVRGWCRVEMDILREAGLKPSEWIRYGQNEKYLYVQKVRDSHVKRIVDRDRRMICV